MEQWQMTPRAKSYLNHYLFSLNENLRRRYTSFSADFFCATEQDANTCADLVVQGEKTATCSLKYWYEQADARSWALTSGFELGWRATMYHRNIRGV